MCSAPSLFPSKNSVIIRFLVFISNVTNDSGFQEDPGVALPSSTHVLSLSVTKPWQSSLSRVPQLGPSLCICLPLTSHVQLSVHWRRFLQANHNGRLHGDVSCRQHELSCLEHSSEPSYSTSVSSMDHYLCYLWPKYSSVLGHSCICPLTIESGQNSLLTHRTLPSSQTSLASSSSYTHAHPASQHSPICLRTYILGFTLLSNLQIISAAWTPSFLHTKKSQTNQNATPLCLLWDDSVLAPMEHLAHGIIMYVDDSFHLWEIFPVRTNVFFIRVFLVSSQWRAQNRAAWLWDEWVQER